MAVIDHQAELTRAGANITNSWSQLAYFVRRYPLGAVGALIVITFVLVAPCSQPRNTAPNLSGTEPPQHGELTLAPPVQRLDWTAKAWRAHRGWNHCPVSAEWR